MTTTTIDKKRLRELEKDEKTLRALEAGGVDNWGGYEFAMEDLVFELDTKSQIEECLEEIVGEISDGGDGHREPFIPSEGQLEEATQVLEQFISKYDKAKKEGNW